MSGKTLKWWLALAQPVLTFISADLRGECEVLPGSFTGLVYVGFIGILLVLSLDAPLVLAGVLRACLLTGCVFVSADFLFCTVFC